MTIVNEDTIDKEFDNNVTMANMVLNSLIIRNVHFNSGIQKPDTLR